MRIFGIILNWQKDILPQLLITGQVILAMFLAGLVGYERETKSRATGFRTHVLVGGSAALFMALGKIVTAEMASALGQNLVRADSVRILQAILTGIAFLGAGAIIKNQGEGEPHGLTTAASILFVAGIGITVASSQYILAVLLTLLALFVLHGLQFMSRKPD